MNANAKLIFSGLLVFFILRSLKNRNEQTEVIPEEQMNAVRNGLSKVIEKYGEEFARNTERVLRIETRHFKSKQWKEGNTSGMEAVKGKENAFPYGWSSLREFSEKEKVNPSLFSTYSMIENRTGIRKTFIKFPDAYIFILFLAWFIKNKRNGRFENWYSLNEDSAKQYAELMKKVRPRITNELI